MPLKYLRTFWACSCLCLPFLAYSETFEYDHIEVELISQYAAVEPGKPFSAAVRLAPEKHWKIYWRNPGDTGLPTRIEWTVPEDSAQEETLWSYPERVDFQGIVIYGYGSETTLLTRITPPDNLDPAAEYPLAVSVSWLICNDVCM